MFSAWSNHESEYPSCEGHVSESREAETLCLNNTAVSTCHEGKNVSQHSKTWCSWYCRYWQFFAQESFSAWIHVVKWFVFQPFSVFGQSLTTFPDLLQVMSHGDTSLILGLIPLNKMYILQLSWQCFFFMESCWIQLRPCCKKKDHDSFPGTCLIIIDIDSDGRAAEEHDVVVMWHGTVSKFGALKGPHWNRKPTYSWRLLILSIICPTYQLVLRI